MKHQKSSLGAGEGPSAFGKPRPGWAQLGWAQPGWAQPGWALRGSSALSVGRAELVMLPSSPSCGWQ